MRNNQRAGQVVRFWRTIEMFSPQSVPKATSFSRGGSWAQRVLDVSERELAPWQAGHPVLATPPRKNMTWQFIVYGGLYDISAARAELVKAFGEDTQPADGRKSVQTALFAFTLDAEGCLVADTATLSACAWALSRLRSPGPGDRRWLDGFQDEEREFVSGLNRLVPTRRRRVADEVPDTKLAAAGKVVTEQVKAAAAEAVAEGAKATGAVVGATVGVSVGSVTGPVAGGIAGAVAGKFAERLLTPGQRGDAAGGAAPNGADMGSPRIPHLQVKMPALHAFIDELASNLGIKDSLRIAGVRVKCVQVPVRRNDSAGEASFLNSFIADDLAYIEKSVRAGAVGDALTTYLADKPTHERIDVRAHREALISGVEPALIPGGRWPVTTSRPLVMSQQFAVGQIMRELADGTGLFSVNGPPGTGKTTMLRDLLAAIVVARATKLAELGDPASAFTGVVGEVPGVYKRNKAMVRGLRTDLTGFEMVLATASNDAAANVTAEIPGIGAVSGAEEEALSADYFPDLASRVLGDRAWALIGAVLGNMKNRRDFVGKFWWSDKEPRSAAATPAGDEFSPTGLLEILQEVRKNPGGVEPWGSAVTAFKAAQAKVRELSVVRQDIADEYDRLAAYEKRIQEIESGLVPLRELRDHHERICRQSAAWQDHAQRLFAEVDREYQDWPNHKPGFLVSLSTWFRAGRDWAAHHAELAGRRESARAEVRACAERTTAHQREWTRVDHRLAEHQRTLADSRQALSDARRKIAEAQRKWPSNVPFGVADEERFQLCAPWADEEFTAARNQLFLTALRLHKAFVFNAEKEIRDNLAVIVSVIGGKSALPATTLLAAWQTLFLVVPMISTTFASLPKLFKGVAPESFGWLFIDEAGQATAQQAAGGLWRCKRAVIVGDPQQLEPVVTLPRPAQDALREYHEVHERWTPDITSAQRVADRHARHGTALPESDGDGTVWVGSPLRVHRRCDRPMFEISNTIAYGGDLMIYGTTVASDFPGANTWIDVSGQSRGNWVPAEGEALVGLLTQLTGEGVSPREIRIISPFRDAVWGCKRVARTALGDDFAENNVGTIHTVQGQEANVVVLVLGSAPENEGARRWASEKPNLLNVAASRAKRRLYVIGSQENWRKLPHFDTLADILIPAS